MTALPFSNLLQIVNIKHKESLTHLERNPGMWLSSALGTTRSGTNPDNWRRIEGRQWWLS